MVNFKVMMPFASASTGVIVKIFLERISFGNLLSMLVGLVEFILVPKGLEDVTEDLTEHWMSRPINGCFAFRVTRALGPDNNGHQAKERQGTLTGVSHTARLWGHVVLRLLFMRRA